MTAFTCGMDDLRLTDEGNTWRKDILKQSVDIGRVAATEVTNLDEDTKNNNKELLRRLEEILRDDNKLGILDAITQSKVNAITSQVVSKCVPDGTMKRFPYNSMQAMALSGAKGSNVNVSQIMCLLGQQALEGRRVPLWFLVRHYHLLNHLKLMLELVVILNNVSILVLDHKNIISIVWLVEKV